jgi:prevent-host-death family protein
MTVSDVLEEPGRIDEPQEVRQYSEVLTQVATEGRAVIVRRNGEDLAAVVPLEQLELLREMVARQEAENRAAQIDWTRARKMTGPPQQWFDATDNPFEPEVSSVP